MTGKALRWGNGEPHDADRCEHAGQVPSPDEYDFCPYCGAEL